MNIINFISFFYKPSKIISTKAPIDILLHSKFIPLYIIPISSYNLPLAYNDLYVILCKFDFYVKQLFLRNYP